MIVIVARDLRSLLEAQILLLSQILVVETTQQVMMGMTGMENDIQSMAISIYFAVLASGPEWAGMSQQ